VRSCNFSVFSEVITAFSALTLSVGWQEGHLACKKLTGMVICLGRDADLHYRPADATATGFTFLVFWNRLTRESRTQSRGRKMDVVVAGVQKSSAYLTIASMSFEMQSFCFFVAPL